MVLLWQIQNDLASLQGHREKYQSQSCQWKGVASDDRILHDFELLSKSCSTRASWRYRIKSPWTGRSLGHNRTRNLETKCQTVHARSCLRGTKSFFNLKHFDIYNLDHFRHALGPMRIRINFCSLWNPKLRQLTAENSGWINWYQSGPNLSSSIVTPTTCRNAQISS